MAQTEVQEVRRPAVQQEQHKTEALPATAPPTAKFQADVQQKIHLPSPPAGRLPEGRPPEGNRPVEPPKPIIPTRPPGEPVNGNGGKPQPPGGEGGTTGGQGRPPGGEGNGGHPIGRPGQGFNPGQPFRPPEGNGWGWQDPNRYRHGWDQWFFNQDPNYGVWEPTIGQEAQNVVGRLNNADTAGATSELYGDLTAMRGDIYAQNELLSEVNNQQSNSPDASSLYLGNWDPIRGSWDTIEVVSPANNPGQNWLLQTYD